MYPQDRQHIAIELAGDVLARDGEFTLDTQGLSMGSTLRTGDRIRLRPAAAEQLRPGRIVAFHTPTGLTAHRILRTRPTENGLVLETKGDAVLYPDPPVPASRVLGVVTHIRRGTRRVALDSPAARRLTRIQLGYARWIRRTAAVRALRFAAPFLVAPACLLGVLLHYALPLCRSRSSR